MTFEDAYRRFHHTVRILAERIIGDFHKAEDLAQETFLRIYLRWPSLRASGALHAWVQRIARNTAIDSLRRSDRLRYQPCALNQLEAPAHGNEEAMLPDLVNALEKMPENLSVTFCLHAVDRYSLREISHLTRTSPGNVNVRLHRARMLLRPSIENSYENSCENS